MKRSREAGAIHLVGTVNADPSSLQGFQNLLPHFRGTAASARSQPAKVGKCYPPLSFERQRNQGPVMKCNVSRVTQSGSSRARTTRGSQDSWSQWCVCLYMCLCRVVPVGLLSLMFRFLPSSTQWAPGETAIGMAQGKVCETQKTPVPGLVPSCSSQGSFPVSREGILPPGISSTSSSSRAFLYQKPRFSPK